MSDEIEVSTNTGQIPCAQPNVMNIERPDTPATDPAELIASSTRLPKDREFVIKRPGSINVVDKSGHYPGCRLVCFDGDGIAGLPEDVIAVLEKRDQDTLIEIGISPAERMNEFFRIFANLLVVTMTVDSVGRVWVLYTNTLDGDELEEFQEMQTAMALHMREWREARERQADAERDAERRAEADNAELMEMGRKAKEFNLFKKLRELEAEIATLKVSLKKAKKAGK